VAQQWGNWRGRRPGVLALVSKLFW
jgi:hypothetical protein